MVRDIELIISSQYLPKIIALGQVIISSTSISFPTQLLQIEREIPGTQTRQSVVYSKIKHGPRNLRQNEQIQQMGSSSTWD